MKFKLLLLLQLQLLQTLYRCKGDVTVHHGGKLVTTTTITTCVGV